MSRSPNFELRTSNFELEPRSNGPAASPLDAARWAPPPQASAPLDAPFLDEAGAAVSLADYLGARPAILVLGYYGCSNLCAATLDGLGAALLESGQGPAVEVVVVSVDATETPPVAAARKRRFASRGSGWHFLTGEAGAIRRLCEGVGFRYAPDEATRQFAHPAGLIVLARDGRVARYLGGVSYDAGALGAAIAAAQAGQASPTLPELLLRCFHYSPAAGGAHDDAMLLAIRLGGGATLLTLLVLVTGLVRRERRARRAP